MARSRNPSTAPEAAGPELTIDELARSSGQSVRNIRAHQSRGLLDPPRLRGRTGVYGQHHLDRLALVARLQSEGFSLASIKRLIDSGALDTEGVLDLHVAASAPFRREHTTETTVEQLQARFGDHQELLLRAAALGLVEARGDGTVTASTALLDAVEQLLASGVPEQRVIEVAEVLARSTTAIAQAFTKTVTDAVWTPWRQAGFPEDGREQVQHALDLLTPTASGVLLAAFNGAMRREIERVLVSSG